MTRYATIVADPPWRHTGTGGLAPGWRKSWAVYREEPPRYSVMEMAELREVPVRDAAEADCRLFLWTTNARLPDSFWLLEEWGFSYRQMLVWHKPDANPVGGSLAPNAEFLLVGVRGAPPVLRRLPSAVIPHPRGGLQHSQKPEVFLDYIEQVSPGPYLELFARRNRLGWDTWGNEALEHVELTA